jgi:DnaJ-class molecular chaperone
MKLVEYYFETSYLCMKLFLSDPTQLHAQGKSTTSPDLSAHLQADYRLLDLQAGAGLAQMRTQYRKLAKCSHPDVGGQHASFLMLRQAYERVVAHLQTHGQTIR